MTNNPKLLGKLKISATISAILVLVIVLLLNNKQYINANITSSVGEQKQKSDLEKYDVIVKGFQNYIKQSDFNLEIKANNAFVKDGNIFLDEFKGTIDLGGENNITFSSDYAVAKDNYKFIFLNKEVLLTVGNDTKAYLKDLKITMHPNLKFSSTKSFSVQNNNMTITAKNFTYNSDDKKLHAENPKISFN